nr:hypothetical protein Hi04_10k_c4586_00008 [uncultured bacterium]
MKRTPPANSGKDRRKQASRAALNALKRARRAAERAGVALSDWEGEFLGSVSQRVAAYGRAFADPEKGAPGEALSARQGVKLKEIIAKAKGKRLGGKAPKAKLRRRAPLGKSRNRSR